MCFLLWQLLPTLPWPRNLPRNCVGNGRQIVERLQPVHILLALLPTESTAYNLPDAGPVGNSSTGVSFGMFEFQPYGLCPIPELSLLYSINWGIGPAIDEERATRGIDTDSTRLPFGKTRVTLGIPILEVNWLKDHVDVDIQNSKLQIHIGTLSNFPTVARDQFFNPPSNST